MWMMLSLWGNVAYLIQIFSCFQTCSVLKVNLAKSKVMGVKTCNEEVKLLDGFCKDEEIPFTYLGIPMGGWMSKCFS